MKINFIFTFLLLVLMSCDENVVQGQNGVVPSCEDPMLFALEDLNSTSSTYGDVIGPSTWDGQIRLFYFSTNEQWNTCVSRFASLNNIYNDYLDTPIDVIVIGIGGNNNIPVNQITTSNNLPWVKENSNCNIWDEWDASNRDLYIMDLNGAIVLEQNLTAGVDETYLKYIINSLVD